ncbi:MAG: glucan biosynthesis glucosyltransferase H, partial [Alphaproteobacteria bacterium]
MDALTTDTPAKSPAPLVSRDAPAVPAAAPLAMPAPPLNAWTEAARRPLVHPERWKSPVFTRLVVFGGMAGITGFGAHQMYKVVEAAGVTPLEWLFLALFVINFSWIALAFTSALAGTAFLLRYGVTKD